MKKNLISFVFVAFLAMTFCSSVSSENPPKKEQDDRILTQTVFHPRTENNSSGYGLYLVYILDEFNTIIDIYITNLDPETIYLEQVGYQIVVQPLVAYSNEITE